jgi:kumamolisin
MKGPEDRVPLAGSERAALPGYRRLHPLDPATVIDVSVVLRPKSQDALSDSVAEMTVCPPQQRHYLSREQYIENYGTDAGDIRQVMEFAERYGLEVLNVDKAASTVRLSGTAEALRRAFGVELFLYRLGRPGASRSYRGRTGPIYIPAELEGIVQAVLGLDDRPQARRK